MVSSAKEDWHTGSRFGLSCRTVHNHRAMVAATSVIEEFEVSTGGIGGLACLCETDRSMEKREPRSVICDYENNNRADGCISGMLPEPGLHGKRERRARQHCQS